MANPVSAVASLRQGRDISCKSGRGAPGRARGQKMARKDGSPRAGKAAAQTNAGGRTVPRRFWRKAGAAMLAAAVAQRRARAVRTGEALGHAEPARCSNSNGLSARPIWNSRGSEFCFGVFWRYRGGRQGHFLPAHKSMWPYRLRPYKYCQ
eukprot:scaffold11564_cov116-Isochrysis_galbana.AAC.8